MEENYKEMYLELFNKVTEVIEQLKDVQAKTEEMYINAQADKDKKQKNLHALKGNVQSDRRKLLYLHLF